MSDRRYPLEPLLEAMGRTLSQAQAELGLGGPEYRRYREEGMSRDVAERKALKAGFHPYEVWLSMPDDDVVSLGRPCDECGTSFLPYRPQNVYCSRRCKKRAENRRRLSTPAGRARKQASNRRYYEACRGYLRGRQRLYDHANRERLSVAQRERRLRPKNVSQRDGTVAA